MRLVFTKLLWAKQTCKLMTGTSSQESYELTAGWDTSALQPAPINISSRKQSLLAVSALFLSIETKQTNLKKAVLRLCCSRKYYWICFVFVWMFSVVSFCFVLFDFIRPIVLIIAVRVGGNKVPSPLSQIWACGGLKEQPRSCANSKTQNEYPSSLIVGLAE